MSGRSLWDGQPVAGWPLDSRAALYGDGVFRTLLVWQGEPVHGREQLDKLLADAKLISALRVHEGGLARRDREAALDQRAVGRRVGCDLRELLHLPLAA